MIPRSHRPSVWITLGMLLALGALVCLPAQPAAANAPAPPTTVWLTFAYQLEPAPRLQGVQLLGCETADCTQPILLQQYGTCREPGCLPGEPSLTGVYMQFDCAGDRCLSHGWPSHGGLYLKLAAQFSDGVRLSNVPGTLPDEYEWDFPPSAWLVTVRQQDLFVTHQAAPPDLSDRAPDLRDRSGLIALSILVELVVAVLIFQWAAKTDKRGVLLRLLMVLAVNLLSLPVVWVSFPALGRFQDPSDRHFGILLLCLVLLASILLVNIVRRAGKPRTLAIITAVLVIAAAGFCGLMTVFTLAYGMVYSTYVQGLSAAWVLILAELFAVVYEGAMMMALCKRALPAWVIWLTSLLMNLLSFGAGELFKAL